MTDLDILVRVKELYKDNCHSTDISTFLLEQKKLSPFFKIESTCTAWVLRRAHQQNKKGILKDVLFVSVSHSGDKSNS